MESLRFNICFGNQLQHWLLVGGKALRKLTARGRRTQGCGSCLCEPVGVAWAWRLQEKRRGRPGLSGQVWCYVVGLVFPHVAFPAQHNEWLPTGLWPWPRLKEYTYQGPEYTPQPASQPTSQPVSQSACVLAAEHSQPSVHLLQTGSFSHCHISHNEKNDLIFNEKPLTSCTVTASLLSHTCISQGSELKCQKRWFPGAKGITHSVFSLRLS